MIKPTFFAIGAAKCGTSSLYHLLAQHPGVCFSQPKEPRFFSHDENYRKGWEWYESCFPGADNAQAIGEGSVHYSMRTLFPETANRIAKAVPEAKIIYIVRHPLDRIASHYRMYAAGKTSFPPLKSLVRKKDLQPNFIDASRYWFQIQLFREYFPDEQIHILFFEEFFKNPKEAAGDVFQFLGIASQVRLKNTRVAYNAQLADKPALRKLRGFSLFPVISKLLPAGLKKTIRRSFLARRSEKENLWDGETYRWAAEQVMEDSQEFLRFYGRKTDTWSFDGEFDNTHHRMDAVSINQFSK